MAVEIKGENITLALAEFASSLRFEDIPEDVIKKEKWHFLDGLGNGLYGVTTEVGEAVLGYVQEFPAQPEATIWGTSLKTSCLQAAMANGTFANVGELEDAYYRAKFKPNTLIVPAALAVGERLASSGRDLLTSMIGGNELGIRVGDATHSGKEGYARGWIGTSVIGGFAVAATVARLLNLDANWTAHALALGGHQPCGLWSGGLAMSKRVMIGRAAENGIFSAFQARNGVTGGLDVLEAEWGSLPDAVSSVFEPKVLTRDLGSWWRTREIGLECYPTKGAMHSSLDALLHIIREHNIKSGDIEKILIRTTSGIVNNKALYCFPPKDFYEAQHSFQFCLAVAAVDRECTIDQFNEDRLQDPRVLELGEHIRMEPNEEADRLYPKTKTAFLDLTTNAGETFTHRVDYCTGEPENFPSREDIHEKFRRVARYSLSPQKMEEVIEKVEALEELGNVRELGELLAAQS